MTPKQQYIESQMKDCRERWFKNHKATEIIQHDKAAISVLIGWQNPGTWSYGCRFIIHRRWLCVVGDIGEATFEWGQDLTLDYLGSIDFGYFLSKCRASSNGRTFEDWNSNVAYSNILSTQAIMLQMGSDDLESIDRNSCRDDYDRAARACYDKTGDAEIASSISSCGIVPSVHAIGMFVGLQMAIAQLKGGAS